MRTSLYTVTIDKYSIASDSDRSAVDVAWEAVLTNSKRAKNLKSLIARSSSENYVSKSKMGLLHRCVLGLTRLETKDLLESVPNHIIDEKDTVGRTPLYLAARRGDIQAVSLLLGAEADQNSKTNSGHSILTAAIMSGNTECIWKILHRGCDINDQSQDGYTPLHYCCRYDADISIIKALLDGGADRNAQTALGHTPLMIATFNKRTSIAKFLIDNHVKLNIQGKDGASALHFAVMSGDHPTIRHLLSKGVNHLLKTTKDETVLHILAQRNGDYQTLRNLEVLFDLGGMNVDDVTRGKRAALTALQIAETSARNGCDDDWLKMFRNLIMKIREVVGSS